MMTADELRRAAADWLEMYGKPCPHCTGQNFAMEGLVAPLAMTEGAQLDNTTAVPLAPFTCKSCGYTFFVGAKALKPRTPATPA